MPSARFPDRATLHVTGADATHFLQNLVTADVEALPEDEARPSALLTPQGKILFDFLVSRIEDGYRLDVSAGARADLAKRLTLYKLRSKVGIAASDEAVAAAWGENRAGLRDTRFALDAVVRLYGEGAAAAGENAAAFTALRMEAGIAEAEADFPAADIFPHDVLLDQNGGVSFRKGCFVGQEVVSRMQHRGTARRRVMVLRGERHLTPGSNLEAGERTVGTVLSAAGTVGIAIVRIDKLADALREELELSVDGVPVDAEVPAFAGYTLPEAGGAAD